MDRRMWVRSWVVLLAIVGLACGRAGIPVGLLRAADSGADAGDPSAASDPNVATDPNAPTDPTTPGDPLPACVDHDLDGYLPVGCGALIEDCNDDDPTMHPGALEVCGNGKDEDCLAGDLPCATAIAALTYSDVGATLRVDSTALALVFDKAQGGVLADGRVMTGSGENLLYTGFLKNERLVGISHFDNWFSWEPDAAATLTIPTSGPAVVQIVSDWAAGGAPAAGISGRTRVTIYPDGRMVRDESFDTWQAQYGYLLAYATLDIARWDVVHWQADGVTDSLYTKLGSDAAVWEGGPSDVGYACAQNLAFGDLFGWTHHLAGATFPDGFRFDEVGSPTSFHLLLSSEWVRDATVPAGHYSGQVLMFLSAAGDCAVVAAQARAFTDPPALVVTVGALVRGGAEDPDGDGFDEATGAFHLTASGGKRLVFGLTAGASDLPTSAYRLDAMDLTFEPTISLDGVRLSHGRDYLWQADSARTGGWLYVETAIPHASQVEIVAP